MVELAVKDWPVTQSSFLSLEEPTLESVELSEHTSIMALMPLKPMMRN